MTAGLHRIVRLSEQAIIAMALNGIEAYSVKHASEGEARLETCGALLGYETKTSDGRILYQIEMANVDTSARRRRSSVSPSPLAMKRKARIIASYWPHLKYIGDFHTHPYRNRSDVFSVVQEEGSRRGDNKGYYLSQGDRSWLKDNSSICKRYGYKVGLVLTIAKLQRKTRKPCNFSNSWVFRRSRPPIPAEAGRLFRRKSATYSDDVGHPLRGASLGVG